MYCPNCGSDVKKGEQLCPRCGHHFSGGAPRIAVPLPIVIGLAVFVVIVVVVVLVVRGLGGNSDNSPDKDPNSVSSSAEPGMDGDPEGETASSSTLDIQPPPLFVPPIASFDDIQVSDDGQEMTVTVPRALAGESLSEQLTDTDVASGVVRRTVADDTVTTVYLSSDHEMILSLYLTQVAEGLFRLQEMHSSIARVEFDHDFKKVELYVDRDTYLKVRDKNALVNAGLYGALYQLVAEIPRAEVSVIVLARDQTTMETVDTINFPGDA